MFLFILYLFLIILMRSVTVVVKKESIFGALLLAIGFMFIIPLFIQYFVMFLFSYQLTYWVAFGSYVVLSFLTADTSDVE
jgi:hypothetical protein